MTLPVTTRAPWKLSRLAVRLRRETSGMAALEFGLIAPILLLMLIGIIELGRALQMHRRFVAVSTSVAELVAREDTVTPADIQAIYGIVEHTMNPYDTTGLRIAVVPMVATGENGSVGLVYPTADGRPAYNGADQRAQCSTYPLLPDITPTNTGVIVVEAEYDFVPFMADSFMAPVTWEFTTIQKPRAQVACIGFDGQPGCGGCPSG